MPQPGMRKDSVTWDRETVVSIDDLGHEVTGHATGFPQTVLCNFQRRPRRAVQERTGSQDARDATLLSETFNTGRLGDLVTADGVAYRVIVVAPRRGVLSSAVSFTRYDLSVIAPLAS